MLIALLGLVGLRRFKK
ncbi:MAG: hypothetical protein ACRCVQ_05355 [Acinetobacter ursingii]|nr:hypothetical protein [Acinetobacter ursingii]